MVEQISPIIDEEKEIDRKICRFVFSLAFGVLSVAPNLLVLVGTDIY